MSRPPLPPTELTPDAPLAPTMISAAEAARLIEDAMMRGMDLGEMNGGIKMANFTATVSEKAVAEFAIRLRESKKYKGAPYIDADGNRKSVSTFDDYCQVFFGRTSRRICQLIGNYHLLGPELYEQAQALKLGQRDYDAIKALPPSDQDMIRDAIAASDRDRLVALMEEMAMRHGSAKQAAEAEKAALQKQLDEHRNAAEASARILRQKNDKIDELARELDGRRHMPDEQRRELAIRKLQDTALNCSAAIGTDLLRECQQLLDTTEGRVPEVVTRALLGAIEQVISTARDVAADVGVLGLLDGVLSAGPAGDAP